MHGVLKVLYGKLRISCFDRLDPQVAPPHQHPQPAARSVLRSTGEYTEDSGPCVLTPDRDNLHQIDAVDGPTAFMDILAPPSRPGRRQRLSLLQGAAGAGGPAPGAEGAGGLAGGDLAASGLLVRGGAVPGPGGPPVTHL
ncbi:hypothetical protein L3Q82_001882 [Scortum barcoo]|uniref:Uncharacterized protein n=1 Tax=Scortum barcoo TaxID=214431 RepID=A0ACB8W6I4_9TELE|nr:hypothetical protein L3Q82_001882 [Scortum barcoo]